MRLSEKRFVEDPVLRKCKKLWPEMACKKMNGQGQKDWPDRMFCIPGGRPFFIEFKSPGELPTPKQAYTIAKLKGQGYDVEVHDDPQEAFKAIEKRVRLSAIGERFSLAGRVLSTPESRREMDPAQLSEEGCEVHDRANGGRPVSRPRARKD